MARRSEKNPDTEGDDTASNGAGATRAEDAPSTDADTAASRRRGNRPAKVDNLNPSWWAPVMVGLMVLGLLWTVAFYLWPGAGGGPIPGIGYGNLAIGFGMIMAGFLMTTRWK